MSILKNILPHHQDLDQLDRRAAEINSYFCSGEIAESEHRMLLEDLVRSSVIAHEADAQEQKILLDQCVRALSLIPVP